MQEGRVAQASDARGDEGEGKENRSLTPIFFASLGSAPPPGRAPRAMKPRRAG